MTASQHDDSNPDRAHLIALRQRLTLDAKVRLLTGDTFWSTVALPEIGLSAIVLSDGPSGVRGERWDERDPSLSLPNGAALAATWDRELALRYGSISAGEARRKGVHVILGPTINLHRSVLGGRAFECFSEDPVLSGRMAASYVRGVQRHGVGATPKHYVANDFETERLTASVTVDERTLRELYLRAFEEPVREAGAWLVMSAYNQVNGVTMTENTLLSEPLNGEWNFDGVVVSDWGAVRSLESARGFQDLVMPGPDGPWGRTLMDAVSSGVISEAVVDRKVDRLLRLAARVGALESVPFNPEPTPPPDSGRAFAEETATKAMVLLKNEGRPGGPVLPLAARIGRIGLYGQNARFARTQGGGSATVVPEYVSSPLDALREAVGADRVDYHIGLGNPDSLVDFPTELTRTPDGGERGALIELRRGGTTIHSEVRTAGMLVDLTPGAPLESSDELVVTVAVRPAALSWMRIGFAALGRTVMRVNGHVLLDETLMAPHEEVGATFLTPPIASAAVPTSADWITVEYVHDLRSRPADAYFAFCYGFHAVAENPDALLREAVESARKVDVAIVVVGTSARIESEGFDRSTLSLDDGQNRLVREISATGTPTVVLVNAGAPVILPWKDEVDAILMTWFGGEAYGEAVVKVLLGRAQPGGRLPMTWPDRQADALIPSVTPQGGILAYDEGLHIGYRAWLRAGRRPAYPFGHGLSYTTFDVEATGGPRQRDKYVLMPVRVGNTGDRDGSHVIQVYLRRTDSAVERPVQWLAAFESVQVPAGEYVELEVPIPRRAFAYWDPASKHWRIEPGEYEILVGRSASDIDARASVLLR
ncbi:beta-glucosidase family protein [Microbacterium sp. F51-2R]|uniref:beta-glucosidase family protein n=1 Tax=Microbacterium sp. F51-2R TaxID=3445777 RepID=UPI003FA178B8